MHELSRAWAQDCPASRARRDTAMALELMPNAHASHGASKMNQAFAAGKHRLTY
ncbi:hypothetical protein [Paraburkholderia sp. UCT70]|uniref:hypothetical protein n=1 Tax=Paraburkholderia sp. UCT70 TaxID=2991068 RepID=UPI003D24DB89